MITYQIYQNVDLGAEVVIELFTIIGVPPRGKQDGELKTIIGDNSIIRSHSVIYAGNNIGHNFQTGHATFLRELNTIGNHVSIGTKTVIEHHVIIEDNVRIHSQAFIPEFSILRNGCWIGPHVVFTNAKYPLAPGEKQNLKGPLIEQQAIIGANSTLLPGIRFGKRAIIGAGSVVTKDVPDHAVVVGNPARIIKMREELPYGECR